MLIAGLTGGMACGKTFVARALAERGAQVIEADELGPEVLSRGGEAFEPVVRAFGAGILSAEGQIDRSALAARVFTDPAQLAKLNALVHPAVRRLALSRMKEMETRAPRAVVIYVAAILLESGADREVSKIIVVTCSREQQISRALERPGTTEAAVLARLASQMPPEEKKRRADYLIDAGGTKEETLRQTQLVWEDLKRQA